MAQKAPEIEHVLEQANPRYILAGGNYRLNSRQSHEPPSISELFKAAENMGMTDRVVAVSDLMNDRGDGDGEGTLLGNGGLVQSLDEPALLLFTSGTTGKPKAAVITHRHIDHQVTDLVASWEWQPTDVAMHLLPLHHVHGVINLLSCAAYVGARLEFQPFNAEALWKQWASSSQQELPKPNLLMAVPTIYAKLLEAADKLPEETMQAAVADTLHPMRLMVSGSAALPVSILHRWEKLARGHTLLERYGMIEFAMALSNPYQDDPSSDMQRRPGYVGRPLPSVQVRLANPDTGEILSTPRVSGELQVKGPTVFQEYFNREDATKEVFTEDGYFKTGDIAQFDGDDIQSYRILGRASVDIIKSGGHKLSALEIERELLEHPDVAEVAVLGVPDDVWGERVALVCRFKDNKEPFTLEVLREWCSHRLSKEKVPSLLREVDEIPKNATGKINKKNLAELFA